MRMSTEQWRNDTERRETDVLGREVCHSATLCTSNFTWTHQASNPVLNISVSHKVKKKKVKCTLVQALRLCTGRTAHRGSRGIALLFHDRGTRRGWGDSVTPRPLFTPGKDPVPIVQETGWSPGPVWIGADNLAPTGIRSPNRPARTQSLYRLRLLPFGAENFVPPPLMYGNKNNKTDSMNVCRRVRIVSNKTYKDRQTHISYDLCTFPHVLPFWRWQKLTNVSGRFSCANTTLVLRRLRILYYVMWRRVVW